MEGKLPWCWPQVTTTVKQPITVVKCRLGWDEGKFSHSKQGRRVRRDRVVAALQRPTNWD